MKSTTLASALTCLAGLAALAALPTALAHGDENMTMGGGSGMEGMGEAAAPLPEEEYAPTYFAHPEHKGVIYAHIVTMIVSWVLLLPVAVMLSLARSRYTLVSQFVFVAANGVGVLLAVIYNTSTPDLYPNNAHHKLGWIITWVVGAQVLVSLLGSVTGALKGKQVARTGSWRETQGFMPVSTEAMEDHNSRFPKAYRLSNDSGQGTEPSSESSRPQSLSSGADSPPIPLRDVQKEYGDDDDDEDDLEAHALPGVSRGSAVHRLAAKAAGMISSRAWSILMLAYNFIDRTILILGFIALCTGVITFGRFFEGDQIFTGLAHWIKGGIFFWLGLLTLGRWAGSFGDLGWAWNVRPKQLGEKWRPSAEFVESGLIFIYGITNIFLEHLGGSSRGWSPQDLEHLSITVLFIGGGLCGMLIESTYVRDLLNMTVSESAHEFPERTYPDEQRTQLEEPESYRFSMNPFPALVILLLGIMMSSHTQTEMTSSMLHKQWGNLLSGASFTRVLSYVLTFLRPPKSIFPSRPPTELLTSFGLITGGILFMASSGDTVTGMVHYGLDAMYLYTFTLGLVGMLMSWELIVIALKGWAVRRESGRPAGSYRTV